MDIELICVAGTLYALLITFMIHLDFEHVVLVIINQFYCYELESILFPNVLCYTTMDWKVEA